MVHKYRMNILFRIRIYSSILSFDHQDILSMKTKTKIRLTSLYCNTKQKFLPISHIRAWFKYKSDNIFAAGPVVIIPILALISICLILIFSSLYFWTGETHTYSQSLWETFTRTLGSII